MMGKHKKSAPGLTLAQTALIQKILHVGKKAGATHKELVSAVETAAVEANYSNPSGGDGSSVGWRQETAESYPNDNRQDVKAAAQRYFDETASAGRGKGTSAGTLAQAVQRSAFPDRYDEHKAEAKSIVAALAGGKVATKDGKSAVADTLAYKKGAPPGFDKEAFQQAQAKQGVAELIAKHNPDSVLLGPGLLSTDEPVKESFMTEAKPGKLVNKKGEPQASGSPGVGAEGTAKGGHIKGGTYPLGQTGDLIGTPYSGTHTLGNWQSDNAVDLGVPEGTPVRAVVSGKIGPQIGSLGQGGRFAGLRVYVNGGGNSYYYAHLSKLAVKAGQSVKRGDIIGYTGSANGVAHLHFASQNGDPRDLLSGGKKKHK